MPRPGDKQMGLAGAEPSPQAGSGPRLSAFYRPLKVIKNNSSLPVSHQDLYPVSDMATVFHIMMCQLLFILMQQLEKINNCHLRLYINATVHYKKSWIKI